RRGRLSHPDRAGRRARGGDHRGRRGDEPRRDLRELGGGKRPRAASREAAPLGVSGDPDRRRVLGASRLAQAAGRPLRRGSRRRGDESGPGAKRSDAIDAGAPRNRRERRREHIRRGRRPRDVVEGGLMTLSLGYKLSSEEQSPADLVRYAQMAEDSGFEFALISDHYHPWTDRQGQSPFVWGLTGSIAQPTRRLVVGPAVTCPTVRIHPAIVAQAAATAAALMPGRFFLGVGTGENLNEHILGDRWPETEIRQERLTE